MIIYVHLFLTANNIVPAQTKRVMFMADIMHLNENLSKRVPHTALQNPFAKIPKLPIKVIRWSSF